MNNTKLKEIKPLLDTNKFKKYYKNHSHTGESISVELQQKIGIELPKKINIQQQKKKLMLIVNYINQIGYLV